VNSRSASSNLALLVVYALLVLYAICVIYPMFWLTTTSLKPDQEIFLNPFSLPKADNLEFKNFTTAWTDGHFGKYLFNSLWLTLASVALTVLLSAMAAYALARFSFWGARPAYFFFLGGLMIPIQLAIVPLFFELKGMGLLNSRFGLLIVYLAFGFPFSIFILTGFFKTLPASLHEAARIDGAGEFGAFWHVMLPLARPGLITVAIFLFLGNWNEFLVAFITLSGKDTEKLGTLPLGLANLTITSQYRSNYGVAFAGLVMALIPTLLAYLFLQKHLTKGITAGAVKG